MNPLDVIAGNPIVDRLACALVHSLWEGLLIAGALAMLLPALRGRPSARYAAGWLALVLMAGSVPLTAWLVPGSGGSRAIAGAPASAPGRTTPSGGPLSAAGPGDADRRATPAGVLPIASAALAQEPGIPASDRVSVQPVGPPSTFDLRAFVRPSAPWIVGAWAIGAVLLALWRLGGWVYLHRLTRRASAAPESLQAALDRLRDRLGVRCAVRLLESASVRVPAVVGWLRPVILLPIGLLAGITPEQLELILAHELAHIRRRDFLANLIQTAIETGLFYHPAIWWVSRTVRVEREACCDDLVVAAMGEPLPYARALARLAEFCIESGDGRRLHLPVAADGGDLLPRVRRIVGAADFERRGTSPRLAGSLAVLGMMAGLAGYAAVAVETTAPSPATAPQVEAKSAPAAPRAEGERPRLVRLQPADGAADVNPETDLRFRFDRPMDPAAAVLEWDFRGQARFRPRGPLRYDPASHEFTLPARLTPGRRHVVTINSEGTVRKEAYEGFRAAGGPAAAPVRWSFTTAGPKPAAAGPAPRMISVSPASDAEVALLTPVEVTFDRPMDPAWYPIIAPEPPGSQPGPALAEPVVYEAAARRFTLLVQLPPNWYGELKLEGFRGAEGGEAEPIALKYRTLRDLLAPPLRRRVELAADSERFRSLIGRIREACRKVTSVSEDATTVYTFDNRFWSQGATFKMRGDDRFMAEIDEIMHVPFRIGSDGASCWSVASDRRLAVPARAIHEKNVHLVDPFGVKGEADAGQIIRAGKLEDGGEVDLDGRRCHLIRSWDVTLAPGLGVIPGPRWYIDAATLLPVRVAHGETYAIDFAYSRINEPIPDAEFRPAGAAIPVAEPEPLPEGYTRRFLNVIDGTGGRMSVRWGMEGPKGRNSSGLN